MSWFGRGELERRVDSLERRAGGEPRSAQDPRVAAPRLWSDNFGALATRSLQLIVVIVLVAGIIWGLWIAGFAKRFTRSSGMALSSTRACALTWRESSPPEGRM